MRRLLILAIVFIGLGLLFWVLFTNQAVAPTQGGGAEVAGTPVSFVTVASGNQSSITRRANFLITSQDELGALWNMIDAQSAPPTVDFNKEAVVAVFAGQEPTGGYSIAVSNIADASNARYVDVSITKPGSTCVLPQAISAPYEIIEIPQTTLPMKHQDAVSIASCLR